MSPFESENARLTERIAQLDLRAQVALFAAAAEVLLPRYGDWAEQAKGAAEDRSDLLGRAVDAARRFVDGDEAATNAELLSEVEAGAPGEPSDVRWATTAQDCWICADTAVRSSLGDYAAQDATWYMLEAMFQTTSERLFGFTDVGSERQDEPEGQALKDPALRAAVSAVDAAADALAGPDAPSLDTLVETLGPIRPRATSGSRYPSTRSCQQVREPAPRRASGRVS